MPHNAAHRFSISLAVLAVAGLSACSAPVESGVNDPYEEENRTRHEFNRKVDRALLRPAGNGYVSVVPAPVQEGVSNFADNLGEPSHLVNHVLQGNAEGAIMNTMRFAVNSTIGLGGLIDMAGALGMPEFKTDFGETLYTWGVGEGAYVELPVFGPSTQRDTAGRLVDIFTNPLTNTLPTPESNYARSARIAARVGDRGRFGGMIDSVLYESADSYAQSRMMYLQNRRFELGADAAYDDPYATGTEPSYEDPYDDPYADPYAQD
ncbi:VacJ family lipoprotein [Lutimaribacter sp. EGI FJ00015]|uniref:VacJ family lipoprotein n=1 Tax=Lutimaribacter degradans TaxID=2945989 RepID=A0ACC5ZUH4_9RHOB|nr:VacJ family lipoprotein [Lutimaribacter sp. EGI FJ00013]MCM2561838.1 VacJ family lipoprotein [Lutimaribacter sp. EGI FJ00013]MCO0613129.1 VacJ family lipoprotein [Lutimaribacter sp. EGI FJ00015]MCO0635671.1 VacJ family lipoprotein [Lutimaribacter sp. EGI FJ00014]